MEKFIKRFKELALHTIIGEVNASHVSADVFHANTITSPIRIDSVHRATHGLPLDFEIGSVLGRAWSPRTIEALVDLPDKQGARIEAKSANNDVAVVFSDTFLGEVEVKSTLKQAYIYEADDSESQLDWCYKTSHRQHALKYIKGQTDPARQAGRAHAISTFGEAQLKFLGEA